MDKWLNIVDGLGVNTVFPLVTMVILFLCSCRAAIRAGGFSSTGHTAYILSAAI